MPTTPRGISFPDSAASTSLWLHYQDLAETADTAIGAAAADTLADAQAYTDAQVDTTAVFSDRYRSTDQDIPNNADVAVNFDSSVGDDVGVFYRPDFGWEATVDGLYLLDGAVSFESSSSGQRVVSINHVRAATTTNIGVHLMATGDPGTVTVPFSKKVRLLDGDVLYVVARQTSGGTLGVRGVTGGLRYTRADLARIGA